MSVLSGTFSGLIFRVNKLQLSICLEDQIGKWAGFWTGFNLPSSLFLLQISTAFLWQLCQQSFFSLVHLALFFFHFQESSLIFYPAWPFPEPSLPETMNRTKTHLFLQISLHDLLLLIRCDLYDTGWAQRKSLSDEGMGICTNTCMSIFRKAQTTLSSPSVPISWEGSSPFNHELQQFLKIIIWLYYDHPNFLCILHPFLSHSLACWVYVT